jgi:guanine deaminase
MDRNSPPHYIEDTQQSIRDTEIFINYVLDHLKDPRIMPIITPRSVLRVHFCFTFLLS